MTQLLVFNFIDFSWQKLLYKTLSENVKKFRKIMQLKIEFSPTKNQRNQFLRIYSKTTCNHAFRTISQFIDFFIAKSP